MPTPRLLTAALMVLLLAGTALADAPLHNAQGDHDDGSLLHDPSPAAPAMTAREQLLVLLSGHHGLPPREEIEAAVPTARALLWEIAHDEDQHPIQRDRAVAALAWWPDDDVRALYRRLISDSGTRTMLRHRAIAMAGAHLGPAMLEDIAALVDADDLQLRLSAIEALHAMAVPEARRVIERLDHPHQHPIVHERVRDMLR